MTSVRRLMRLSLIAAIACAVFATWTAHALGAKTYVHFKSFDGSETKAKSFGAVSPSAIAVDNLTGRVYVVDVGNAVLDVFDADGKFLEAQTEALSPPQPFAFWEPSAVAVDNSGGPFQGYVYVAEYYNNVVDVFGPEGSYKGRLDGSTTPAGSFLNPAGVAVDSAGAVHVSDNGHKTINKYVPGATPVSDADFVPAAQVSDAEHLTNPAAIAFDADDNLYVTNFHQSFVKLDPTGAFLKTIPNDNYARSVAVDRTTGNVLLDQFSHVVVLNESDEEITRLPVSQSGYSFGIAVNESTGRVYVADNGLGLVDMFNSIDVPAVKTEPATDALRTEATLHGTVNTDGVGDATCQFEYGPDPSYGQTAPCAPAGPFTDSSDHAVSAELTGLTPNVTYHYRLVGTNANGSGNGADRTVKATVVSDLTTGPATNVGPRDATLTGSFDPAGEDTRYFFEYGKTASYGGTVPVPPGNLVPASASGVQQLAVDVPGLTPATTYHFRIVVANASGTSNGEDVTFITPPGEPLIVSQSVTDVHSDSAVVRATIDPSGGQTKYRFEWGLADCAGNPCTPIPVPDGALLDKSEPEGVLQFIGGLDPGTTYHFRTVAVNATAETFGPDRTFTTFPKTEIQVDSCENAHVRQQTGAALLLDCRAYELVSAANSGGFNVASNLVPGQAPFGGYPEAMKPPQVLYSIVSGRLSVPGNPTNLEADPYVATRDPETGWRTDYVGLSADNQFSQRSFASTVADASAGLDVFAFGGPDICSPCFDGGATGIPVRMPDGSLEQGMTGSIAVPVPVPAGKVRVPLSADGSHLFFGSRQQFEPGANDNGSDITLYSRDLISGETRVVSKAPGSDQAIASPDLAVLDASNDGSRVLFGQLLEARAEDNDLWRLYIYSEDSDETEELAPGVVEGAAYDGMTTDGLVVYFSTRDPLTTAADQDTDTSVDLFRADLSATTSTLSRVSTGSGGSGDTDLCEPTGNSYNPGAWNAAPGGSEDCSIVPALGAGGVAREEGSVHFMSPELLDGFSNGVAGAPNLYLDRPGEGPRFVATLESSADAPLKPPTHLFERSLGPFTSPNAVAIDAADGSVYVFDIGKDSENAGTVRKFSPNGGLDLTFADSGVLDGSEAPSGSFQSYPILRLPGQIAVDNALGSPSRGALYVPDVLHSVVDKFDSDGNYISQVAVGFPGAVATDPDNGDLYVASRVFGTVYVFDQSGAPLRTFPVATPTTGVAVDSNGKLYVTNDQRVRVYNSVSGAEIGTLDPNPSFSVTVDPSDDHVYVSQGNKVVEYAGGAQVGPPIGVGRLSDSVGVAAAGGVIVAANRGSRKAELFSAPKTPPDPAYDNPLVIDSSRGRAASADLQVSPDGRFSVFPSSLALDGAGEDGSHYNLFRYDADGSVLDCVSCAPTGVGATTDSTLARDGLSLSDDGRVFFESGDALAPRDLNGRRDVYEWSNGEVALVSTGGSGFDSGLLSISADAKDAYFFTRDKLVGGDENGSLVRIYDARAGGGFAEFPPEVPCQASDECHGPGTVPAPHRDIGTYQGSLGNERQHAKCKKGKVRRKGRCVNKKKSKRGKAKKKQKRGGRSR